MFPDNRLKGKDTKNANKMQLTYSLLFHIDKYKGTCNQYNMKLLVVFLKVIVLQNISKCEIHEYECVQPHTMFKVIERSILAWPSWTKYEIWVR